MKIKIPFDFSKFMRIVGYELHFQGSQSELASSHTLLMGAGLLIKGKMHKCDLIRDPKTGQCNIEMGERVVYE